MIQVSSPRSLFNGQKVYRISKNVEKQATNLPKDSSIKLVLIYQSVNQDLSAELQKILDNIIEACKFSAEKAISINHKLNPISLGSLQRNYAPKVILIFGEMRVSNNLEYLNKNYPYEMNGVKILRTETLEKLDTTKGEKKALWTGLQQMLGLK